MKLTQAVLQELLSYDPQTGELKWKRRSREMFDTDRAWNTWNSNWADKPAFTSIDRKGYRVGSLFNKSYRASRIIFKLMTDIDPDKVDHEDGDRLNNRWVNLRDVNGFQNQQNMKKPITNTSGHVGVCWNTDKNCWTARLKTNGKNIHLGHFKEKDDAIAARKQGNIDYGFHPNHGR
jgi:hypothetical protein